MQTESAKPAPRTGMMSDLATYLKWITATAPLLAWGAFLLIVLSSLSEGLGLALLPSILSVAGLDLQGAGNLEVFAHAMSRALAAVGLKPTLAVLLVIFFLLTSMRTLLRRVQYLGMLALDQSSLLALRNRLYRAVLNANWLFLCRSRSAEFAHALTSEMTRVGQIMILSLTLAGEIAVAMIYGLITLVLSPAFAGLVVAAAALLIFLLRGTVTSLHDSGARFSAATQRLHNGMSEVLQHLKTAKTYGAEGQSLQMFVSFNRDVMDAALDMGRRRALASALFEGGSILILCLMIYVLIEMLHAPAAGVLMLLLIFARLIPHLQSGHQHFRELAGMLPSFANVMEQVRRCEAAAEPPGDHDRRLKLQTFISLDAVTFSYGTAGAGAVRDIDLVIGAGKIVALVGPSGAGKSTIIDLIMGLLTPQSGAVSIDGHRLAPTDAHAWRKEIGYVAQDAPLLNLTVRDNMLWGRPDATDDEIMAALQRAGATPFIEALPAGLDSIVGERGILFSQGERQRLALARALLRKPALLILDEATNGLDAETETLVMRQIDGLRATTSVLLVAHRLSTIRWADLVYVIDAGAVAESGRWDDLNRRSRGRFRALCEAQYLVA